MGYDRILVPLDGSILAEMALEHVTRFANPGARLHLLSVMISNEKVGALPVDNSPSDLAFETKAREMYLEKIAATLKAQGFQVIMDVRPGAVVETIVEVANRDFELVVIATHHRSGLSKLIFGSVAERLIQETHCPVVVI